MPEIKPPPATDAQALTAFVMPYVAQFMTAISKLPPEERQRRIARVLML